MISVEQFNQMLASSSLDYVDMIVTDDILHKLAVESGLSGAAGRGVATFKREKPHRASKWSSKYEPS